MRSSGPTQALFLALLAIAGVAIDAKVVLPSNPGISKENHLPYGPEFKHSSKGRDSLSCQSHTDGLYSFTIEAEGVWGPINLFYVQQNGNRRTPFATTALHNSMNHVINGARKDNFRKHPCGVLADKQANCSTTFRMTDAQSQLTGLNSFDRGHLSPANPFRFSQNAVDETFYCVNIAPQEPYTNQGPWNVIEGRVHQKLADRAGYVMTGVCDRESPDGPTRDGWWVPECYWKLICYTDDAGNAQVVGFIGENTLLDKDDPEAKPRRSLGTRAARHQVDILEKLGPNAHLVADAWENAQKYLLENRFEPGAPSPFDCTHSLHASRDVIYEWSG